jgi:hypothetical protein
MGPRQDEKKTREGRPKEKDAAKRRFRIIRLEERIAPGKGGNVTHKCSGFYCHSG